MNDISPLDAGLRGVCPRCGSTSLFSGPIEFVEACGVCGLPIRENDNGDGPIFLVITIIGFLVTGLATYVELVYMPSFWVHAILWIPFILVTSVLLLRLLKGMMLASQYKHKLHGHDNDNTD